MKILRKCIASLCAEVSVRDGRSPTTVHTSRVMPSPIIRSANNCTYSIWHLSHRYYYLPLSWKSWDRFECAVGGVRHPQHTQTSSNTSTIVAGSSNGVTNTRCCRYNCLPSWWWLVLPPETCRAVSKYFKLCNVSSCWIYVYWNIVHDTFDYSCCWETIDIIVALNLLKLYPLPLQAIPFLSASSDKG
jgi:hypothetical protein